MVRFAIAFFSLVALVMPGVPSAEAQTIYAAIKVNDATITNFDIDARVRLLRLQGARGGDAQRRAEDELIDEALQRQEAARLSIGVDPEQVQGAFNAIAQRLNLSPAQLRQGLRQAGVSPQTLIDRLESQLLWNQVIQARFRATVRVREEDVVAAMIERSGAAREGAEEPTVTEYQLQSIVFVVPEGASDAVRAQRRREATALRSRFQSCAASLDLVRQLRDVAVREPVRRFSTDVSGQLRDTLAETPNGRLTPPIDTQEGVEVIAVCDKREVRGPAAAQREVQGELMSEEGELMARGYIRDLRASATIIRQDR
ncbi:MAG: peptidylprolyl isomerase [Hyphomicrobiaceae bacterium]|nr:peptidylprolyl isomerase [Hyphomicrobiaceae bacterium]